MKVSFIIPIYNVESFIDRCLESVIGQGLSQDDFEVILVDDHSTDSSYSKCLEWVKRHDNFHVVSHSVNQGVGAARNTGMAKAQGDYIIFLDSDDYLCPDGVSYLFNHFDVGRYDLIRFWSIIVEEGRIVKNQNCSGNVNYEGDGEGFISRFGLDSFCVTFLYRRDWLLKKGLSFTNHRMVEDYLFISKVFLNNPTILSTTCRIYYYMKRKSSATTDRSSNKSAENAKTIISVIEELMEYSKSMGFENQSSMIMCVKDSAHKKMLPFISRVLTSDISKAEFGDMTLSMRRLGVIPVGHQSDSPRSRLYSFCINNIFEHPNCLSFYKYLYRVVLYPFFVSHISKN